MKKLILSVCVVLWFGSFQELSAADLDLTETYEGVVNSISYEDKQKFREIVTGVLRGNPTYLTNSVHKEFWSIWDKWIELDGNWSPEEFDRFMVWLRRTMTGIATVYQKLFWEDALWATTSGRPFKSSLRDKLEKEYLRKGLLNEWRIEQNEILINKIANKEAVSTDGRKVLFDENTIRLVLDNLESAGKRVEWIFTR